MQYSPMNYRVSVGISKLLLSYGIFAGIFYDFGFIDVLCGPMAVKPQEKLFIWVLVIQAINAHYGLIVMVLCLFYPTKLLQKICKSYFIKYLILFILKLFFIMLGKSHRSKYYFHAFVIEAGMIVICLLFDFVNNKNMQEVVQITLIDFIHKISMLYQLTRTFCPKFSLYWFIATVLFLVLSQIQSYIAQNYNAQQSVKNKKHMHELLKITPQFYSSLYVKQDTHRFLIFGIFYFGMFAFLQAQNYGYGMLCVFALTFLPYYQGIKYFDAGKYFYSIFYIFLVVSGIVILLYMRIYFPLIFKPLVRQTSTCLNDPSLILLSVLE